MVTPAHFDYKMKRRSFLHLASLTGLYTLISPKSVILGMPSPKNYFSEDSFLNPPYTDGPYTWWHWMNGNITKSGITKDLEAMSAVGIAGFQLFEAGSGIPLGSVDSLGEEWTSLLEHTIKESGRLGLEFAMHNCPGWSSSGGPWITPELSMQELTYSEVRVSGGNKIEINIPQPLTRLEYYRDTFLIAFPESHAEGATNKNWRRKANFRNQDSGNIGNNKSLSPIVPSSVIDLSEFLDDDGLLSWQAPEGEWTIIRFGHTPSGQQNHSAPTLGTGLDCDKLSRSALEFHFDKMFSKVMPILKSAAKAGKVGLLIDSYEMGLQNWTSELPVSFEKRNRYAIAPFLPALLGRIVGDSLLTEQFLWDFRRTLADMMSENYYGHFQHLCKKNNLITYTEPYGQGPFEEMQVGAQIDINMGEFWAGITNLWPNSSLSRTVKLAASISRIKGEATIGAESFTAEPGSGKWQQYPFSMKSLGDRMFTKGVTRYYFHRYAHQPHPTAMPGMTMGPWGIHFERTNTWWKPGREWLKYITRCQHLLRQGRFFAKLLYFTGEEVPTSTIDPEYCNIAPPKGYDYDLINNQGLRNLSKNEDCFSLPGGTGYKVLILPEFEIASLDVLRDIRSLVEQGLILVGTKPKRLPGLSSKDQLKDFNDLISSIWGDSDSTNKNKAHQLGKGRVYVSDDLAMILSLENILPDIIVDSVSSNAPINYIHRKTEDVDIYFLANNRRTEEQTLVSFAITGCQPELWDPSSGKKRTLYVFEQVKNHTKIPLNFDESGSCFLVFRKVTEPSTVKIFRNNKTVTLLHQVPLGHTKGGYSNTFCISGYFKPEIDIALQQDQFFGKFLTDYYAIFPADCEAIYGKGHAGVGMTVGRNGIVLFERYRDQITAILSIKIPLSGWTHIIVGYENNAPSVFINGIFLKKGKRSKHILHYSSDQAAQYRGINYYNGDIADIKISKKVFATSETATKGLSEMPKYSFLDEKNVFSPVDDGLLIYQPGQYKIQGKGIKFLSVNVEEKVNVFALPDEWIISFPVGLGAPAEFKLGKLQSLHKSDIDGVRHFSGTASYSIRFVIGELEVIGKKYFLDLGRVEVISAVTLNGKSLGIIWKRPYRVEITEVLVRGTNELRVEVTNLWPNRLIGDELLPQENEYHSTSQTGKFTELYTGGIKQLPDWYRAGKPKPQGGRVTFTTWKAYSRDSPLLESGLLGPVAIICIPYISLKIK